MGVKVAIVGAGKHRTRPNWSRGSSGGPTVSRSTSSALLDIDPSRLDVVGGLARRMLDRAGSAARGPDRRIATRRSTVRDFVIVQLRASAARPPGCSTRRSRPGSAASGRRPPGRAGSPRRSGPFRSCSSSPSSTGRRGAPGRWFVDFTNPTGLVTQALLDREVTGDRPVQRRDRLPAALRRAVRVEPERVELEHVGLNHLSWVRAVKVDGVDRLPGAPRDRPGGAAATSRRSPELRPPARGDPLLLPALLLPDLGGARAPDPRDDARRGGRPRSSTTCSSSTSDPDLARRSRSCSSERGGAFYSEAAAQLDRLARIRTGDVRS